MTSDEMMTELKKMSNSERNKFLDNLYDEYFDTGLTAEQRTKIIEVWEAYENGELVQK